MNPAGLVYGAERLPLVRGKRSEYGPGLDQFRQDFQLDAKTFQFYSEGFQCGQIG